MKSLRLGLAPVLPTRTPSAGDCFEYGFGLRLPGGRHIEPGDPLLAAYGAGVYWLDTEDDHDQALQHDAFDPGRLVQLIAEPFDPEDPHARGVWDAESVRQAGTLPQRAAEVVSAAVDSGLEQRGLVLEEHRAAADDRRERLCLLIHSPSLVRVRVPANLRLERPARPSRPRLVLWPTDRETSDGGTLPGAPGRSRPATWDSRPRFARRRNGCVTASRRSRARATSAAGSGGSSFEWEREALNVKAAELWERARSELGRRYAIGFLGSGMRRPVWSPTELTHDEDDFGLS